MTIVSPVFVVGVGRSGTSLIQSMLAAHPQVAFPPETAFVRRYVAKGTVGRLARREGIRAVVELLAADERLARLDIGVEELVEATLADGPLTDAALYRSILRLHARACGAPRVGDKDPRLVEHLGLVHRLFPRAFVVHIIRDPRDVLVSKKRAEWSRDRSVLRHILANRVQLAMGRRDGARWFGERYVELQYEKLLDDPVVALKDVCARIELSYDPSMLDFRAAASRLVSPDEIAWKSKTLGPLLSDNRGKWRDSLSAREVSLTQRVCAEAMRIGRYEKEEAELRPARRLIVRVEAWFLAQVARLYPAIQRVLRARLGASGSRL